MYVHREFLLLHSVLFFVGPHNERGMPVEGGFQISNSPKMMLGVLIWGGVGSGRKSCIARKNHEDRERVGRESGGMKIGKDSRRKGRGVGNG